MADTRKAIIYRAVGRRLADLRSDRGLTQEDLAGRTGGRVSRSAIANIECGRQRVGVHHLFDLADALGVQPVDLLRDLDVG